MAKFNPKRDAYGLCVNLHKMKDGKLRITFTREGRRAAKAGDLDDWNLFEDIGANSQWEFVQPEEIDALTDATILSDECQRDDHGELIKCGRVYSNIDYYQVEGDVERLLRKGELIWGWTGEHLEWHELVERVGDK